MGVAFARHFLGMAISHDPTRSPAPTTSALKQACCIVAAGTMALACSAGGGGAKPDIGAGGAAGSPPVGSSGGTQGMHPGMDGGPTGQFGMRPEFPDGGCNPLQVGFEEINPTVMLLIDRSGSMWDAAYGAVPTRWQALSDALMNPATSAVNILQKKVRWGLTTYTNDGNDANSTCPLLDQVPVSFDNYEAIRSEYDRLSSVGRPSFKAETPTGESIRAVTQQLQQVTEPGPKFIIVATDGEPDDCRTADPQCGQDLSIKAAQDAFALGIKTFVIGIGNEVGEQHLRDLANAGAGLPVTPPNQDFVNICINAGRATRSATYAAAGEVPGNAPYYQPADPAALEEALRTIISSVRTCNFELNAEVNLNRADEGRVLLDGERLDYGDPNGWRMTSATELEIIGQACQRILTDSRMLDVSFPCDVAVFVR